MYDQGRFFTVTETIAKARDRDDFYSPGAELAAPVQPRDGRELPPPDRPMAVARKLAADLSLTTPASSRCVAGAADGGAGTGRIGARMSTVRCARTRTGTLLI
jgi:hypothetical protein